MKHNLIILISVGIFFAGCSTSKKNINIEQKPKLQVPKQLAPVVSNKGSLYSRRGASLFSDKKDLQIGDIIQIYIDETLTNDSTDTKNTKRTSSTGLGGGIFGPGSEGGTTGGTAAKLTKEINRFTNVGFSAGSENSFTGSQTQSSDEEFTTVVSAIIQETYQNGNYLVMGTKEVLINGQKQNLKISGVIRPYDITPDNTVYSYQLANLKIYYEKEGVEEALDKPWGSKAIESVWPF